MTLRGSLAPLAHPAGGWAAPPLAVRESRPPEEPKPCLLDRVREAIRARPHRCRTGKADIHRIRRHILADLRQGVGSVELPWVPVPKHPAGGREWGAAAGLPGHAGPRRAPGRPATAWAR